MLSLRTLAKYAAVSGLAIGLITGAGSVSTYAGMLSENSFNMDYETNTLTIHVYHDEAETKKEGYFDAGEPKYVYLGIGKTDAAIKQYDRFKLSASDVRYTTGQEPVKDGNGAPVKDEGGNQTYKTIYIYDYYISIPLPTHASPTIEYVVKAYTDVDAKGAQDAAKTTLAKQTKKLTAKYDPLKQILTVKADSKDLKVYGDTNYDGSSEYEIRTLYGADWMDPADLTEDTLVDMYATYGTTLIVRECAVTGATGKPASKEIKVKIPKKANGPKATINPTKMTITIPNNAEWRIIGSVGRIDKVAGSDPFVWTAELKNKEGWIKNSTKTAQLLDVLQKAVTDAKAVIDQIPVANSKEDIIGNIFEYGATIELRMPATTKKAASKISFYNIPAQDEEIGFGDNGVSISFNLNAKQNDVSTVKVKNGSNSDIEVAFVDSSYDISKVKFTKMTKGSEKNFSKNIAKEGKFLLVRSAAVNANAKQNIDMRLGGVPSKAEIKYPKVAGTFSNFELKNSTLTVKLLADGKGYAYKKSTEDVVAKDLGIGPVLPGDAVIMERTPETTSLNKKIDGLEKDKYLIIYEYDLTTKVIINMASHKIAETEIKDDTPVGSSIKDLTVDLKPTADSSTPGEGILKISNPDTEKQYCYNIVTEEVKKTEVTASADLSAIKGKSIDKADGALLASLTTGNYIVVYEYSASGDTTTVTGFVCHRVVDGEFVSGESQL